MLGHELIHSVVIEEPVNTQDPTTGENVVTWQTAVLDSSTTLASVPALVLTGAGSEAERGGVILAEVSARIRLRWFAGLLPTWRILWDGQIFNIGGISTDKTGRREYRLICTEGVNEG